MELFGDGETQERQPHPDKHFLAVTNFARRGGDHQFSSCIVQRGQPWVWSFEFRVNWNQELGIGPHNRKERKKLKEKFYVIYALQ
jgi:hypothetical protein